MGPQTPTRDRRTLTHTRTCTGVLWFVYTRGGWREVPTHQRFADRTRVKEGAHGHGRRKDGTRDSDGFRRTSW